MNRRNAVKNLAIASGSLITLPFWMQACRISDKNTHLSSFSPRQQQTLAQLTDAIIPAGNAARDSTSNSAAPDKAIGALAVGTDKFLQKLIDDCYDKPVQDNVRRQLDSLDTNAQKTYSAAFADCTLQQRQTLLMKWSNSTDKDERSFLDLMKSETIRGFSTSQNVMEGFYHYKVAPGHYYGSVNTKA